MAYFVRPKRQNDSITVLPYFTSNDTLEKEPKAFIATVHDEKQRVFSVAKKTPTLITIKDPVILKALTLEIHKAKVTNEAWKSPELVDSPQEENNSSPHVSSSRSSVSEGHSECSSSECSSSEKTELSNDNTIYSPSSLDSPKIGNLLSANPSINNVYMVEMDFVPRKTGQLEIQQGQSLGISKIFDNGWALGVRLDSPEAGLVPRSHLSASPIRQQVQCDEQRRSSKRYSLPQQAFNALSSRFYTWLAKDHASHDMLPV
ncbi:hypothetical protein N7488_005765 [Penicillium malachiteum]|nr:hypothetical protein N7488_005765 [Penicillium malachiteum]